MDKKTLLAQVEVVLNEKIRPALKMHAGDIEIVDFNEKDCMLLVNLKGTCQGCGFANETLYGFVEDELRTNIPDIQGVQPADGDFEEEDGLEGSWDS